MSKATECDGKQAHATKAAAERHRRFLMRGGATRLRTYKCKYCSKYHVGHLRRLPNGRRPTK